MFQLSELQEEMRRKEGRWTSASSRLRDRVEALEAENEELKEEVRLLERKRLEWLARDDKVNIRKIIITTALPQTRHCL